MPLLQGQPFKLVKSPVVTQEDAEVFTISHTGEKFLQKSEYDDRLALYSQTIWMCQCTGRSGLTHQEAWSSEALIRVNAMRAVPLALHKPLLMLVHHSLSPLDQLVDASSILCHSQFHIGEELVLHPKQIKVCVLKVTDGNKQSFNADSDQCITNGVKEACQSETLLNGSFNGLCESGTSENSPGKENQSKQPPSSPKDEGVNRREMLPKLYTVVSLDDQSIIENVSTYNLQRNYKIPSKDQLRLFIRSCALRLRGSTCTPWVVSDDLLQQHNIINKLPSLFLSSRTSNQPVKRKAPTPASGEVTKRPKQDKNPSKSTKQPVVHKSNMQNYFKPQISQGNSKSPLHHNAANSIDSSPKGTYPVKSLSVNSESNDIEMIGIVVKSPEKMAKLSPVNNVTQSKIHNTSKSPSKLPKFPNSSHLSTTKSGTSLTSSSMGSQKSAGASVVKKRGRPRLTDEQKAHNKKMRQATLFDMAKKNASSSPSVQKSTTNPSSPQKNASQTPKTNTLIPSLLKIRTTSGEVIKAPFKKISNVDSLMRLPMMKRLVHEHKTSRGIKGMSRRMAYTMDNVLGRLNSSQIEMVPDEGIRKDLLRRQQKLKDKQFLNTLTPEQRKEHMRNKARLVALERWKERKLKNVKIEDQILKNLKPLPEPTSVPTTEGIPNSLFGDIAMVTEFVKCFRELLLGEEKFRISTNHMMEAISAGPQGYKIIADIMCCLLSTIIHDDISKNCNELGVPLSVIPVNYQTAPELARLCLKKQEFDDSSSLDFDEGEPLLGREKNELAEELLLKLEREEFWTLNCFEVVSVLKALVHKALVTSSLSVFVEETEIKVGTALRERRKLIREMRHERDERIRKKKLEKNNDSSPKRKRGRPRGSTKFGTLQEFMDRIKKEQDEVSRPVASAVQQRRLSAENKKKDKDLIDMIEKERLRGEEDEMKRRAIDKKYEDVVIKRDNLLRRQPIGYDRDHNRYWIFHTTTPGLYVEKGWAEPSTDCQYVIQKGCTKGRWMTREEVNQLCSEVPQSPSKLDAKIDLSEDPASKSKSDDEDQPLSALVSKKDEDDLPLSLLTNKLTNGDDDLPLSILANKVKCENLTTSPVKSEKSSFTPNSPNESDSLSTHDCGNVPLAIKNEISASVNSLNNVSDDENKPLSNLIISPSKNTSSCNLNKDTENEESNVSLVKNKLLQKQEDTSVKSKLTLSPMKMTTRGKLPKEAYVFVDEDTQTFPSVGESHWFYYPQMDEVKKLLFSLSDEGQRESQLAATLAINKERLQYHYNLKPEPFKMPVETPDRLKESLKEDIVQIERELIEGWLGSISNFDDWEQKVMQADDVSKLGELVIEAQKHMQLKFLKGIMTPEKKVVTSESSDSLPFYEEVESLGVVKWREEVASCKTYSRLHLLVGIFDNCIKWEKSMACRKCKICRSKSNDDPLAQCDKCDTSYHLYCLRPPLKELPGDNWLCPACVPKKTRRQELHVEEIMDPEDPEEKNDPTFIVKEDDLPTRYRKVKQNRNEKNKIRALEAIAEVQVEKKCKICQGRMGLIICSKCNSGYHSECHEPPLLTRARKDWICGSCLNPKEREHNRHYTSEFEYDEEGNKVRRNYFGVLEKVSKKKIYVSNGCQRDKFGRFIKGANPDASGFTIPNPPEESIHSDSDFASHHATQQDGCPGLSSAADQSDSYIESQKSSLNTNNTDKFGRSIRGAKSKALESMSNKHQDEDRISRRSGRNVSARKSYKDDSDEESEEDSEPSEDEELEEEIEVDVEEEEDEQDEEEIENNVSHLIQNIDEANEQKGDNEDDAELESEEEKETLLTKVQPHFFPKRPSPSKGGGKPMFLASTIKPLSTSGSDSSDSENESSNSSAEEEHEEQIEVTATSFDKKAFPAPIRNLESDTDSSEEDADSDSDESDGDESSN